ncbi:MAG: right-handed parallel beta-helix repeat-containing protein [Candidatus Bathyarchaeota archaeon]|nr:right-handed parallel beta-helix repeat-containing protein [Candidatus Bathyarchaeota archaeon]
MKETICYLIASLLVVFILVSTISSCSIISNVIISTSGSIYCGPLHGNPAYDYTMVANSTAYYIVAKNGSFIYSNNSPTTTLLQIATKANNGGSVYINCSFTITKNQPLSGLNNVTFVFDPNSTLTMGDNVGNTVAYTAVLDFWNSNNIKVINATINGNSANQGGKGSHTQGISFHDCNNSVVIGAKITDVRMFGFNIHDSLARHNSNNGIINSTILRSGWNDINLGEDNNTIGAYAINNTVGYCSDVGIATYGWNCEISNNIVLGVNNTIGGGGSAHYGIAVEDGGNNLIQNNTVTGCSVGIILGTGSPTRSNFVVSNNIANCITGIHSYLSSGDVITKNNIVNWGAGYTGLAIYILNEDNDIISFNTMVFNNANAGGACSLSNVANVAFCNNTIIMPVSAPDSLGVALDNAYSCLIQGNSVQALAGILVSSSCNNNKINNNSVNSTYPLINNGVATIINPLTSSTYRLIFNNIYDSSSRGTYTYSKSIQITISSTTLDGSLNVNGVNVTLTSGSYTLLMNADYFVYALSGTVTITP